MNAEYLSNIREFITKFFDIQTQRKFSRTIFIDSKLLSFAVSVNVRIFSVTYYKLFCFEISVLFVKIF